MKEVKNITRPNKITNLYSDVQPEGPLLLVTETKSRVLVLYVGYSVELLAIRLAFRCFLRRKYRLQPLPIRLVFDHQSDGGLVARQQLISHHQPPGVVPHTLQQLDQLVDSHRAFVGQLEQ